ncbi:putative methyl-CpG-binding domain protein 3-like 5 [Phodopus roborovskii]|uniref:Mbd3l2 protein n=1 Tax=Phodopus roborovskii TaxID=109678 RepID=A0AAU9YST3_PHORO|nr:putative methyl-CpG-binding domain protein 3-like 5 [Phodopus roborovskii]CAH6777421.1 Mbd3l2 [Phodopus roborovskii]
MQGSSGNSCPSQPSIGRLIRSMIPQEIKTWRAQPAQKKAKAKQPHRGTPVRMTSCIFSRPVARVTSHPENITKYRRNEKKLEKPQRLCVFSRLQKHLLEDRNEELLCSLDITNVLAEAKVQSWNNPHTSPHFTSVPPQSLDKTVQESVQLSPSSFSQGVRMPIALQLSSSLFNQVVTTADIRRQAQKVKTARKRLAKALEADRLARQAETMGE